jgi:hypothetical protein
MNTTSTGDNGVPYTVAIVAMGPSRADYMREAVNGASARSVADEIWAINAMAGIIQHDKAIIMDDLRYFAKAGRDQNEHLRGYADWLAKHPGPIFAQKTYSEFPGAVAYPIREVCSKLGYAYFNSTVAYAVALAIHEGVKHLKLYGCDFTGAPNADGQSGRACVEFWLGRATLQGMRVTVAPSSTLCDQQSGRVLYGYSTPPTL